MAAIDCREGEGPKLIALVSHSSVPLNALALLRLV